MKPFLTLLLSSIFLLSTTAGAKGQPGPVGQRIVDDQATAQNLLHTLTTANNLSSSHANTLQIIQAKGLKPSAANVETVQRLVAKGSDREMTVNSLRLLASLHTPDDQSGRNQSISRTLKTYILNGDRSVALTALQEYSRTGYQPDGIEMLDYGLANKIIDENAYCQELVLGLQFAPAHAQIAASSRLFSKNNGFAAQVLALTINDREVIRKIAPEARKDLLKFMNRREPGMPMAIGEFGINDGGRYAEWLDTVALLSEAAGEAMYDSVVLKHLSDERIDPRKILGYMTSAKGKQFMKSVGRRDHFAKPAARAIELSDQFPGHPIFTPFAQDIRLTLSKMPR